MIVVSLGLGGVLELSMVRGNDGVRLRVQVGDDQVADVAVSDDDLAALRELLDAV